MTDQPPVPWDQVPEGARWMARDVNGEVCAWSSVQSYTRGDGKRVWYGKGMTILRQADGGQHEPKKWKRP